MANEAVELNFRSVIKGISLTLRRHGFTRRGTAYRYLSEGNSAIIQVQRSRSSDNQVIRFTLNTGVISGRLLRGLAPDVSKSVEMHAHLRQRIGCFLSPPREKWWEIGATSDVAVVLDEITPLLDDAAHYVITHIADEQLIALWESGRGPGLTEFQRLRNLSDLKAAMQVS
ncbi:DUF4304 domain-containing protein [Brevundimonas sp. AAP58]|uniref:DUF4304 domain-containing protein n=1 Tax=Brevundimonas sp. AAP58 TaxID=1523422 RepID=UPI0009EB98BD|nr:DUF4304 domain-containing protein [Brevundimonas sp. AAP58]